MGWRSASSAPLYAPALPGTRVLLCWSAGGGLEVRLWFEPVRCLPFVSKNSAASSERLDWERVGEGVRLVREFPWSWTGGSMVCWWYRDGLQCSSPSSWYPSWPRWFWIFSPFRPSFGWHRGLRAVASHSSVQHDSPPPPPVCRWPLRWLAGSVRTLRFVLMREVVDSLFGSEELILTPTNSRSSTVQSDVAAKAWISKRVVGWVGVSPVKAQSMTL